MRAISRREKDIQACQSIIQKNTDRLVNIGDKPDSQAYERYRKKFVYDHANEVFIAPLTEEDWLKSTTNHWNLSIRSPTREITDAQSELARLNLAYKARLDWLESSPVPVLEILELLFEVEGADVQFRFNVSTDMPDNCRFKSYFNWNDHSCVTFSHISNNYHLRIECKPVIGDDYPAVLRQMKANSCDVLLIGHGGYRGVGATSKQMEQIFAASGIKVMLLSQIND
jgi:hypothetical protein